MPDALQLSFPFTVNELTEISGIFGKYCPNIYRKYRIYRNMKSSMTDNFTERSVMKLRPKPNKISQSVL